MVKLAMPTQGNVFPRRRWPIQCQRPGPAPEPRLFSGRSESRRPDGEDATDHDRLSTRPPATRLAPSAARRRRRAPGARRDGAEELPGPVRLCAASVAVWLLQHRPDLAARPRPAPADRARDRVRGARQRALVCSSCPGCSAGRRLRLERQHRRRVHGPCRRLGRSRTAPAHPCLAAGQGPGPGRTLRRQRRRLAPHRPGRRPTRWRPTCAPCSHRNSRATTRTCWATTACCR